MDKFEEIFSMQKALNERIGVYTDGLNDEEKAKWVLNYTRAMEQELAEGKGQKFDVLVIDAFSSDSIASTRWRVPRMRLSRIRRFFSFVQRPLATGSPAR